MVGFMELSHMVVAGKLQVRKRDVPSGEGARSCRATSACAWFLQQWLQQKVGLSDVKHGKQIISSDPKTLFSRLVFGDVILLSVKSNRA